MAVLKCKICGGDMEISPDKTFGTCEYCGSTMTLPKIDDDQRAAAFNRGNHFRRAGEFDQALQVYERIVAENPQDAEAHWCCALCRFGIEWVEDPATMEYLPTCHRASLEPFTGDVDYLAALEYSDGITRRQYQKDAARIADVQKGILATSQNEQPFDVFICYKESDANGNRTVDSTLAQDVYYRLTDQGLRVFFARITLEDKVGQAYEPYIFAALNSAKVMVVIGTKPEHFNAVWVKNEWSRYLSIVKRDRTKVLLPCYKDMDPYDLPEQLSVLQSYDMSQIGFVQDLIRGIQKVVAADAPTPAPKEAPVQAAGANVAPLLERAFLFLEDGKWQDANIYCEKVLDIDPKNVEAYLGKLLAELQLKTRKQLADCAEPFDNRENYGKVLRFGNEKLKTEMRGYITHINERNETARLTGIYERAVKTMKTANSESKYKSAAKDFQSIPGFKDADVLAEQCLEKAEICRKEAIYNAAKSSMTNTETAYKKAAKLFQSIPGYRDADALVEHCLEKAEICRKEAIYNAAKASMVNTETAYKEAAELFQSIPGYRDADTLVAHCLEKAEICRKNAIYNSAKSYMEQNTVPGYEAASEKFRLIPGWKDADEQIAVCQRKIEEIRAEEIAFRASLKKAAKKRKRIIAIVTSTIAAFVVFLIVLNTFIVPNGKYNAAVDLYNAGKYDEALAAFTALNGYRDSNVKAKVIRNVQMKTVSIGDHIVFGAYEQDNNASNGKEDIKWFVLANKGNKVLVISQYALDCQQYNSTTKTSVTWETCSLRKWLNETFLSAAFSSEEQNRIISSTVTADKNPEYSTSPGNNTTDKLFLFSIEEVNKYFGSDWQKKCRPTEYAIARGASAYSSQNADGKATTKWWLRSPGDSSGKAALVHSAGFVSANGYLASDSYAVRPAMWISLDS